MCDQCGCAATPETVRTMDGVGHVSARPVSERSVALVSHILQENNHLAAHNREHLDGRGILAVNLMSSPGSGKTSLLETTIAALKDRYGIAVIEGDLETENDARRIRAQGVPAVQITTGQTCHLDAQMVHDALHALDLSKLDILFIENVGNLVCPASFDLGQHANVTLLSVTEGDDKPAKYPAMFRIADLVLLSKADLLDVLGDFSPQKAETHIRDLASACPVMALSARRPETLAAWFDWLRDNVAARKKTATGPAHHHHHRHTHAAE
jgi:hydrogenase nickel incorporation protein HypB